MGIRGPGIGPLEVLKSTNELKDPYLFISKVRIQYVNNYNDIVSCSTGTSCLCGSKRLPGVAKPPRGAPSSAKNREFFIL